MIINNDILGNFIKDEYQLQDIQNIIDFLEKQQTFYFPTLNNNLFSASAVSEDTDYTGYSSVWVRDNVYIAYCHYLIGKKDIAVATIKTLLAYIKKFQWRFTDIIEGNTEPNEVMKRPHVRFRGDDLTEIDQKWQHAQNDAWGYFLWFYCRLAREKLILVSTENLETLALFPFYFQAIKYWQDEDSGHWEEERKIAASSIGVVVAGLKSFKLLLTDISQNRVKYKDKLVTNKLLDELINKGTVALNKILPAECIQSDKKRRYDAALLFLIYPLQTVEEETSAQIIDDVINNLQGNYGIRRYLMDSFWCRDYQDLPEEIRTSISEDREKWLQQHDRELQEGEEAQWCIFDSIISAIYGTKYQKTNQKEYLQQQTFYLNRSLGQLTAEDSKFGGFKCPELYYLQNGDYIPNDATPLLWTQANLRIALKVMEDSFL